MMSLDFFGFKNTLAKIAAKNGDLEDLFDNILSGQIGIRLDKCII